MKFLSILFLFSFLVIGSVPKAQAATPAQFGLYEGATISASGSSDPDVYIVNDQGYKRLFLNPIIFKYYGHFGGFGKVRSVTATARDVFPTSGLFRNCQSNDEKVYGLEVTAEDSGVLHWVNTTGTQAVQDDPDFFKKVFCINNLEFNWYPKGQPYYSAREVPDYSRTQKEAPSLSFLQPTSGPVGSTVTITGSGFTPDNNTVNFGSSVIREISSNGTTVSFIVPSYTMPACLYSVPQCGAPSEIITPGAYSVSVSNSNGTSNQIIFTVTSDLAIQTLSLPNASVGTGYSTTISASGGSKVYSWKISSCTLPPVLSLVYANCVTTPCMVPVGISGTPTTAGSYTFTMTVFSGSQSASREFMINVSN